jgi:hypothetical protein
MGAGESVYVQNQERFVNNNINNYKKVLPSHYSNSQIKGKLRQLYANSDTCQRNKNSYIVDYEWSKIKQKVTPVYSCEQERNGYRQYH